MEIKTTYDDRIGNQIVLNVGDTIESKPTGHKFTVVPYTSCTNCCWNYTDHCRIMFDCEENDVMIIRNKKEEE